MNARDFETFSLQAKHEREAREWQEWDQTVTRPASVPTAAQEVHQACERVRQHFDACERARLRILAGRAKATGA